MAPRAGEVTARANYPTGVKMMETVTSLVARAPRGATDQWEAFAPFITGQFAPAGPLVTSQARMVPPLLSLLVETRIDSSTKQRYTQNFMSSITATIVVPFGRNEN